MDGILLDYLTGLSIAMSLRHIEQKTTFQA